MNGVDKKALQYAWNEWKRLGCFEHGSSQRNDLFCMASNWMTRRLDYSSLRDGLHGTVDQRIDFRVHLITRCLDEMMEEGSKGAKDWSGLSDYVDIADVLPNLDLRGMVLDDIVASSFNPDDRLGKRYYDPALPL
jgi:hypothetical protein